MKTIVAIALFLLTGFANAGALDYRFTRWNATYTFTNNFEPPHPSTPGVLLYNTSSFEAEWATLSACLQYSSGILSVATSCVPVNADWNANSGLAQILNKPAWLAGFNGSFATLTGKPTTLAGYGITDAYPLTGNPSGFLTSIPSRSFNYTTRALNTCFQVSATRDALVNYAVDIQTNLSLTSGQQGTVYMRIYSNSACTTGTQELTRFVNGQTGALTIGLALTQNVTATLSGMIPAGSYVQLVTENNTGTPTFTARPGQETLF